MKTKNNMSVAIWTPLDDVFAYPAGEGHALRFWVEVYKETYGVDHEHLKYVDIQKFMFDQIQNHRFIHVGDVVYGIHKKHVSTLEFFMDADIQSCLWRIANTNKLVPQEDLA